MHDSEVWCHMNINKNRISYMIWDDYEDILINIHNDLNVVAVTYKLNLPG